MKPLVLLLITAGAATAMVPQDRRMAYEEESNPRSATAAAASGTPLICAQQTPCAWSIYNPRTKYIEDNLTNTYCVCSNATVCVIDEDDSTASSYVHRCRAPGEATQFNTR